MSVVAIPFSTEPSDVVAGNIAVAASHRRIDEVWAIGHGGSIVEMARDIAMRTNAKVEVIAEERIGTLRPGKGDAMNTALRRAASEEIERLHFYDADINNFGSDWIDGAEHAADRGFEVVRHTFPRAATDAMITWFITKPLLAMKYPGTVLPRIGQPLGGELLLSRAAIGHLATTPEVSKRSDWGIDTLLTHGAVDGGFSLFEHHVAAGKQHALYGSLGELREMVVECFDAAVTLPLRPPPQIRHERDPDAPVPEQLKRQKAYSVARSAPLVSSTTTKAEEETIESMPAPLRKATRKVIAGVSGDVDAGLWWDLIRCAARDFRLGDEGWERLLFRLWVARVLSYTNHEASHGYDRAMNYLAGTIRDYERESAGSR